MIYFIVPVILTALILFMVYIAITEEAFALSFVIIFGLILSTYFTEVSYDTKIYETTEYSVLCDEYVCIIRIDNENITFQKKRDYDRIKSNDFIIEVEEDLGIFGNSIRKSYEMK